MNPVVLFLLLASAGAFAVAAAAYLSSINPYDGWGDMTLAIRAGSAGVALVALAGLIALFLHVFHGV